MKISMVNMKVGKISGIDMKKTHMNIVACHVFFCIHMCSKYKDLLKFKHKDF